MGRTDDAIALCEASIGIGLNKHNTASLREALKDLRATAADAPRAPTRKRAPRSKA